MKVLFLNQFTQKTILNGCLNNEPDKQEILYKHFSPKMFGICLRYAKDYPAAEDLLQDGFMKVFKNLAKFRGDGSLEGWVRRIVVNTCIEHYRKNSKIYPVLEQEQIDYEYYDDSALHGIQQEDLLTLINQLSAGYRTVFNLYVIEGYSHKEIAKRLDISEGTSKSQLARARYILQKKVVEHYGYLALPKENSAH